MCAHDGLVAFIFRETVSFIYSVVAFSFHTGFFVLFLKANQITAIYEKLKAKNVQVCERESTRRTSESVRNVHVKLDTFHYGHRIKSNYTYTTQCVCVCASISDEEDDEERRADGERRRE